MRNALAALLMGLGAAAGAAAQAPMAMPMDEHAHHRAAMSASPERAKARVMERQPSFGDLSFLDQDGRVVALRDVLATDEPVMLNFIFTTCTTICPVMSAGFASLEKRLSADRMPVRLVSISIDPEMDIPSRLRAYAQKLSAGADWQFLTGTTAGVEAAQRALGAFRGSKEAHSASTFIRRGRRASWEQLDGLASGETLLAAYRGTNER